MRGQCFRARHDLLLARPADAPFRPSGLPRTANHDVAKLTSHSAAPPLSTRAGNGKGRRRDSDDDDESSADERRVKVDVKGGKDKGKAAAAAAGKGKGKARRHSSSEEDESDDDGRGVRRGDHLRKMSPDRGCRCAAFSEAHSEQVS